MNEALPSRPNPGCGPVFPLAEPGFNTDIEGMAPHGPTSEPGVGIGAARAAVGRLTLSDFRCYREARLELEPRPVVLTGPNGAGKTNLLEAVSFLAPGRGLRRARLGEVDRQGSAQPWAVAADLSTGQGPVRIGTGRESTPSGGERRAIRIDGQPARSQAELAERLGLVWLTPQMDRIFLEGAGARRRFLDRLVLGFDAAHAGRCAAYEQAMRQRARLLREGPRDPAWLTALEDAMAREGVAIAAARRDTAARLDAGCAAGVAGFPRAVLAVTGAVDDELARLPALAVEEAMRERLAAARRGDAESGGAVIGPHRSDLAVRHGVTGTAAEQCSTGEQKALLVAIVLAHARLMTRQSGSAPILLLDEVAAHLDAARRGALFAELAALDAQSWLTGTDAELFAPLLGAAQFLTVREAAVLAAD